MKKLLMLLVVLISLSCSSLFEERVVEPPYDPNIKLDVRPAPPPPREEVPRRIPEYPQYPTTEYQISQCSLMIYNNTVEEWEVLVNGVNKGILNKWSTSVFPCGCDRVSVEMHSGFPNFKTMHKHFYSNERQGDKFIWRLHYK